MARIVLHPHVLLGENVVLPYEMGCNGVAWAAFQRAPLPEGWWPALDLARHSFARITVMVRRTLGCVFWATFLLTVVPPLCAAEPNADQAPENPPRRIDFRKDVAPILQQSCVECHGGTLEMAGLRLDEHRFVLEGGNSGSPITPGSSQESLLVQRLVDKELGIIMPPAFPFFPG